MRQQRNQQKQPNKQKKIVIGPKRRFNVAPPKMNRTVRSATASQYQQALTQGVGKTLGSNRSVKAWTSVYMNPFLRIDARLPTFPVRSTLCQFRYEQFVGHTNSNGFGFCTFIPMSMMCSDLSFAFFSNGPTAPDSIATAGAAIVSQQGAGPYTKSSFNPGAFAVRLVAWGFRVRYTGTELNRGGTQTFFQMNPRNSTNTLNTGIINSQWNEWKQYDFDMKKKGYTRMMTENDDSLYCNTRPSTDDTWYYVDDSGPCPEDYNYMCLCINSATAGAAFEVEVAGHFEVTGKLNNTTGTAVTTVNTAHIEKVVTATATERGKDNSSPDHLIDSTPKSGSLAKVGEALGLGAEILGAIF